MYLSVCVCMGFLHWCGIEKEIVVSVQKSFFASSLSSFSRSSREHSCAALSSCRAKKKESREVRMFCLRFVLQQGIGDVSRSLLNFHENFCAISSVMDTDLYGK